MSDVPVATLLVAAVVVALMEPRVWTHLSTGLLVSVALLVRPNLAPLTALFLGFAWLRGRDLRTRLLSLTLVAAGLLPGIIAIAAIHTHLYGAPWKSGYGSLEELYAVRYAWANLVRYPRWLFETQSPLIAACLVPPIVSLIAWRRGRGAAVPAPACFLGVLTAAIWLSYLFYLPFDDWDYLRFVLASFPLMLVLAVIGWQLAAGRLHWESRAAVVFAVFLVALGFEVGRIQNLVILGRWKGECAEMNVAEFVKRNLPPNAVIVSLHFSGLLRHYADRQTLRYDWLDRDWWPRAVDALTAKGYRPYIVLIDWEESKFRERFGLPSTPDAAPLGTVIAELGQPVRARIYDPTPSKPVDTGASSKATLISPDAACPCTWRPGSSWQ